NRNIASDIDTTEVVIVFIRARGHVAAILQRFVADDAQIASSCFRSNTPETSGTRAEQFAYLFRMRRTHGSRAQTVSQFDFVKRVIYAKQNQNRALFAIDRRHEDERLDLS